MEKRAEFDQINFRDNKIVGLLLCNLILSGIE